MLANAKHHSLTPRIERGALGAKKLAPKSLPIIDIQPLFGRNLAAKRRVADEIGEAARNVGFFYIRGHGLPQSMIDATYAQAERFFALPLEQKLEYYIAKSINHRGYVPQTERGEYADEQGQRHYEAYDLGLDLPADDLDYLNGRLLVGPNVWPRLESFKPVVADYLDAISRLAQTLCRAFELHLGLAPGYLRQFMTKPTSQLRMIHYRANTAKLSAKDMNMGAHTDYECFTILHQTKAGLQVMNTDNEWIEAPPIDGTFVVNIGDMLETWTNGAFKSTLHRVVNLGQERYSMPFFMAANYDAVIEPLPGIVSPSNPPRYRKVIAGHHLLGQLLRDFSYLKKRYQNGLLKLDFELPLGNPYEARLSIPNGML